MADAFPIPSQLDLQKDEALRITWQDGRQSTYPIDFLRTMCPCASCKTHRENQARERTRKKTRLTILPGNYSGKLHVTDAELVGNYAIRLHFSDGHESGIFSFRYLRDLEPA